MHAAKIMLCAIGATIMTSAAAYDASARTVEGINGAGIGVFDSIHARPAFVDERASTGAGLSSSGSQVAINPQPLPPRGDED